MTSYRAGLVVLSCLVALTAQAETQIEVTLNGVPKGATQLLLLADNAAPTEAPGYEEPAANTLAAAAAAAAAPADPAAAQAAAQRRRRLANTKPPPPLRAERVLTAPTETLTWRVTAPAGDKVRVRVVALSGDATFPLVVAGGKATGLKVAADSVTPVAVALVAPTLKLAENTPKSIAPGAKFTVSGVFTDPANFLGAKGRMRVWQSAGNPPKENRAGIQYSTVDVTTKGDDVTFTAELIAPREPGSLFLQLGESGQDFARADGTQVPFIVAPDVTTTPAIEISVQGTAMATGARR